MLEPTEYYLQLQENESHIPQTIDPTLSLQPTDSAQYPIVASFEDWVFPGSCMPLEWIEAFYPPATTPSPNQLSIPRCCITGFCVGRNDAYLIPRSMAHWFNINEMLVHAPIPNNGVDNLANIMPMRADLYWAWDANIFVLVPKPVSIPSKTSSPTSTQFALAVHVLMASEESLEIGSIYQNVAVAPSVVRMLSR